MSKHKKGCDPISIANYFIDLETSDLYLLKLLKLCYIAHGFVLAGLDKPLSSEPALAWPYGPVFESVFFKFRQSNSFQTVITKKESHRGSLLSEEKEIIKIVSDKYGKDFTGSQLSALTHAEGTPWRKTFDRGDTIISDEEIKDYYKEKLKIT